MGAEQPESEWMEPSEVADDFKIPVKTLYAWKYRGVGPQTYRFGRHLRYKRSEVAAWADQQATPAAS